MISDLKYRFIFQTTVRSETLLEVLDLLREEFVFYKKVIKSKIPNKSLVSTSQEWEQL